MQLDITSATGSALPSTITILDALRPIPGDLLPYTDANGNARLMLVRWVRLYASVTGGSSARVGCESSLPPPPPPP